MSNNYPFKSFVFPGNIDDGILKIGSSQVPYMRTQWFSHLIKENEKLLLEFLDCEGGKIIPYTASGTAAMDACVVNFVANRRRILILNGGSFGQRWVDICKYYQLDYVEFKVPFGEKLDFNHLEALLGRGEFDVMLMQHHETSSGALYDINKIGNYCRRNSVYLIADVISSFLTDPLSLDQNNIDIAILSSQKGLDLPPGLSFIVLTRRVLGLDFSRGVFYYDWEENLNNLERGQTPYSPATILFMQLHERLILLNKIGIKSQIEKVRSKANAFREKIKEKKWNLVSENPSNCLTGVYLPYNVKPLVDDLLKRNIYVMPSNNERMIRIAHLGCLTESDQVELVNQIEKWENQK